MTIKELKESVDMICNHLVNVGLENEEVGVRVLNDSSSRAKPHVAGLILSGNNPEVIVVVKSTKRKS